MYKTTIQELKQLTIKSTFPIFSQILKIRVGNDRKPFDKQELFKKKARTFTNKGFQKWYDFDLTNQGEKLNRVTDGYFEKT